MPPELLVVAGEASGDRIAGAVLGSLAGSGIAAWGVGGAAARAAGAELCADASQLAAMGVTDVARRVPAIARATAKVLARVTRRPPAAALLVNFTEYSARLGRWLRGRGVRVVWCVAPQIWAWRPGRAARVARAADRMAVILPFEEALWRSHGAAATFVGHPSIDLAETPGGRARADARSALGLAPGPALAVLPGSRDGEVSRLADVLCAAAARLEDGGTVASSRVLCAPGLSARGRAVVGAAAARSGLSVVETDGERGAAPLLPGFDLALCASGTAALEAAVAGAAPVVTYRLDPIAYRLARRLVSTPHIGLPNVLLRRRAFPELLQHEVQPDRVADAAAALLGSVVASGAILSLSRELRALLLPPRGRHFADNVAALVLEAVG